MKRPIRWHEECLVNLRKSIERDYEHVERLKMELDRAYERAEHLNRTIARARNEGLTEFDSDRYNVKRPSKTKEDTR